MIKDDTPEALINAVERTTDTATGGTEAQWAAVLILCLIRPAQQAIDTLRTTNLGNCCKVWDAILQILNLSPEAYPRRLREIEFSPDYHPRLIDQRIRTACLHCLQPEVLTKEQIIEAICVELYTALLPFKLKKWVACYQSATLEDTNILMEAYM